MSEIAMWKLFLLYFGPMLIAGAILAGLGWQMLQKDLKAKREGRGGRHLTWAGVLFGFLLAITPLINLLVILIGAIALGQFVIEKLSDMPIVPRG